MVLLELWPRHDMQKMEQQLPNRARPIFFDQVGHETMYASNGNKHFSLYSQSYIYQVLQTIQMKLMLLCVWAEPAVLGSAKTALKFIYKI